MKKTDYMIQEQKQQVRNALVRYMGEFETQQQAAKSLNDVSETTLSNIKNHKWEQVSERMWQHIARQVGFYGGEWQAAETGAYMLLRILLGDAQHYAMAYGIAMQSGLGKTFSAKQYACEIGNTYYVACSEEHNRKTFTTALLNTIDQVPDATVPEMLQQFTEFINTQDEPLLVIDDAHKLKDRVLHFLVTLSNLLVGRCGVVIMGNDELRTRIIEGARMGKEGYEEIYRSIGRRFITLGRLGPHDVSLVCRANGIDNPATIEEINDVCQHNLHTVTQLIHAARMRMAA